MLSYYFHLVYVDKTRQYLYVRQNGNLCVIWPMFQDLFT